MHAKKIPWRGFGPAYEEVEIMINNNINKGINQFNLIEHT